MAGHPSVSAVPSNGTRRLATHRQLGTAVALISFLCISLSTRLALTIRIWGQLEGQRDELFRAFAWGALFDLAAACYATTAIAIYLTLLPQRVFAGRIHRAIAKVAFFLWLYGLLFIAAAEWTFWGEFGARFNFIAVDYLVYTREVIGNIVESFPVAPILAALFAAVAVAFYGLRRSGWLASWADSNTPLAERIRVTSALMVCTALLHFGLYGSSLPEFQNRYAAELAGNGPYAFFSAFRNNALDYGAFYRTIDSTEAFRRIRSQLAGEWRATDREQDEDILRWIPPRGPAKRFNIVQITVESLSAKYLGAFGSSEGLTPNLDAIAKRGVLFTNFRSTGNRTVRGIEALTLGIPPTPGRSVVKRPGSDHLFSIGSVLRDWDYDTLFVYGGYAYFDNMRGFFEGNGYRVIDRTVVEPDSITFSNIWGASDEDVFSWSIEEADRSFSTGTSFHQFVLTTSNHRPFTYPEGRIDIPSHSGRKGGVKYSDWAIGDYFRRVRDKPWFDQTIFVIVADHCAGTSGKVALPLERYEIPLILYAPQILEADVVDRLSSQIDLPATLLALLGGGYDSRFYGRDILSMGPEDERALISTYQSLGYMTRDHLLVLSPLQRASLYRYDRKSREITPVEMNDDLLRDVIAVFQTADEMLETHRFAPTHGDR